MRAVSQEPSRRGRYVSPRNLEWSFYIARKPRYREYPDCEWMCDRWTWHKPRSIKLKFGVTSRHPIKRIKEHENSNLQRYSDADRLLFVGWVGFGKRSAVFELENFVKETCANKIGAHNSEWCVDCPHRLFTKAVEFLQGNDYDYKLLVCPLPMDHERIDGWKSHHEDVLARWRKRRDQLCKALHST